MNEHSTTTIVVIAKEPRPGHAKTRLTPPLTPQQAADVAAAALRDTVRAVDATPAGARLLALDGDPATVGVPDDWRVAQQPDGGLDTRLVAAFEAAFVVNQGAAVLVGMDTPQLQPDHIAVFDPARFDACLGLASDGGFWAIGFADPRHAAAAITGVPMSTAGTGAAQLARLRALGLRVQPLDELTDVDTAASADEVARLAPETRFAATWAQCLTVVGG